MKLKLLYFLLFSSQIAFSQKLNDDLKRMTSIFEGEFDNFWQVQKELNDSAKNVHEHIHSIFAKVDVPAFGKDVFYVKQYMDGNPNKIYRQRLYSFSTNPKENAVQLDIYSFPVDSLYYDSHLKPEKLAEISPEKLTTTKGCEVYWKPNGDKFIGYMKDKACSVVSKRSGKRIYITDSLILDKEQIWIRDEAVDEDGKYVFGHKEKIPHKLKRVNWYKGWISYEKDGKSVFMTNQIWHDQGTKNPVILKDGTKTPYSVELGQLQHATGLETLVLKFYEQGQSKAFLYAWGNPLQKNIGINLRWLQAGLTKLDPQPVIYGRK
jgi:hypothetical protein